MKVLAAMSGGVDSAVAAARAVDAGHDVTGVHLALSRNPKSFRTGARGCCTLEDARDARRAADVLGIPFYVWDLAERFAEDVVDDFVAEYAAGRTPNPCLRCNEKIKFAAVLDRALALGFDAVCTGHYARLVDGRTGASCTGRSTRRKDQSYVLGVLTTDQLAGAMFPLGDTRKDDVRAEAAAAGWRSPRSRTATTSASSPTATPPGSCASRWVPPLARSATARVPSSVRTTAPTRSRSASGVACTSTGRLLTAGRATCSRSRRSSARSPSERRRTSPSARSRASGRAGADPSRRARSTAACSCGRTARSCPAVAEVVDGVLRVQLAAAAYGVAPGQAVVLYDGTRVIGSATRPLGGRHRCTPLPARRLSSRRPRVGRSCRV